MNIGRILADFAARVPLLEPRVRKIQSRIREMRSKGKRHTVAVPKINVILDNYLPSFGVEWPAPHSLAVAVVIPVYRGYEETRRCLESVLENCEDILAEVIVVDDCSPDSRINEWLKRVAAEGRITLINNEKNLGFVASVNRGMVAAGLRDVVLLNSDTEVPAGWLNRLAGHAYSAPMVGTITPFSNNATICSWPTIKGSDLPRGKTLAEVDSAFREANRGRQVAIPTAVGFCMYIRRECLNAVGLFDEKAFGRGYGEENDFCMRAYALGWKHLLACDTFVFHIGETSFGKASAERGKAWDILVKRYREYPRSVELHIQLDEAGPYRFAATAAMFKRSIEPTILIVTHAQGGGTERHIRELMSSVGTQANFLRLEPTGNDVKLSVPGLPHHPVVVLGDSETDALVTLLQSFGVNRVHVHHWIGFGMNLRQMIDSLGVPFDFTIHDYFSICPQVNLLPNPEAGYCGEPGAADCNTCIAARSQHGATNITEWRTRHAWLLNEAARVICPSEDVRLRIARYAPAAALMTVPHEYVEDSEWNVQMPHLAQGQRLRIGLLGVVAKHKGLDVLRAVIEACDPNRFEFIVIGCCEPALPPHLCTRIHETGRYEEAQLPKMLQEAKLHVVWFPATGPETYCYTLSAAIDAKLPIVAPKLGAFQERLDGRPLTWNVVPIKDTYPWASVFEAVHNSLTNDNASTQGRRASTNDRFYPGAYLGLVGEQNRRSESDFIVVRQEGKVAVMVVPERDPGGVITPCGYIRLLQPMDMLAADWPEMALTVMDLPGAIHRVADCLVCQRHAVPNLDRANELIAHCQRHGIRLIYDLDDDLVAVPSNHPEFAELAAKSAVVFRLLMAADSVWLATPELQKRLSCLRPDGVVVRNGLDDRLWSPLAKSTRSDCSQRVRVVYMGTTTHNDELTFLGPIIAELRQRYRDRVCFEIVGVTQCERLPSGFQRVIPKVGAVTATYPGFVEWFRQNRWDIAIAPLLDTTFNRCKSAIKLMDYAAMSLPVVATEHAEYRDSFGEGNGVHLVPNVVDAWIKALSELIDNEYTRREEGVRAREHFVRKHALSTNMQTWRDAISLTIGKAPRSASIGVLSLQASSDTGLLAVPRDLIAAAYLSGIGLEIGALHNPLQLPTYARARYVDRLDKPGLYKQYPELKQFNLVDVDIIDNGEKLSTIEPNTQDFVIANHFLEHCEDPLSTLENLLRVVRPGGIVYIAVPDKRYTFDRDRETTSLSHLIEDRKNGAEHTRGQHFREWVSMVEPHFGRFGPGTTQEAINARVKELMGQAYSIHFHCWTSKEAVEMLQHLRDVLSLPFEIKFMGEYENERENIFILRKHDMKMGKPSALKVNQSCNLESIDYGLGLEKPAINYIVGKISNVNNDLQTKAGYGKWFDCVEVIDSTQGER